jgi:hypothetical protein
MDVNALLLNCGCIRPNGGPSYKNIAKKYFNTALKIYLYKNGYFMEHSGYIEFWFKICTFMGLS